MPAAQLPRTRRHRRTLAVTAALAAVATAAGSAAPGYAARIKPAAPSNLAAPSTPAALSTPAARSELPARSRPAARSAPPTRPKPATRPAAVRTISYAGYRFTVPQAWPVTRLDRHPHTCVRFDRHAVYLGPTGANQDCPATVIGSTEAIQIAPGRSRDRRRTWVDPVARRITATAPRIAVTATYSADPAAVRLILASAGLPAPVRRDPHPVRLPAPGLPGALQSARTSTSTSTGTGTGTGTGSPVPRRHTGNPKALRGRAASAVRAAPSITRFPAVSPPALPANVSNFRGLGFDACAAPSRSYMRAWRRHSPYRAVGIYIGGAERACAQRNLTTRWLRAQAADG